MLLLNEGGIGVFLTSTGTMDSRNVSTRERLMLCADLLGAFRLPDTTFEYTQACCDLIILKRVFNKSEIKNEEEKAFVYGQELLKDETGKYFELFTKVSMVETSPKSESDFKSLASKDVVMTASFHQPLE